MPQKSSSAVRATNQRKMRAPPAEIREPAQLLLLAVLLVFGTRPHPRLRWTLSCSARRRRSASTCWLMQLLRSIWTDTYTPAGKETLAGFALGNLIGPRDRPVVVIFGASSRVLCAALRPGAWVDPHRCAPHWSRSIWFGTGFASKAGNVCCFLVVVLFGARRVLQGRNRCSGTTINLMRFLGASRTRSFATWSCRPRSPDTPSPALN